MAFVKSTGRTVLGMTLAAFLVQQNPAPATPATVPVAAGVAPAAVVKTDPVPSLDNVDGTGDQVTIDFTLAPYDLTTNNKLISVTVVLIPADHGAPTTPDGWLASGYPMGTFDTSGMQDGESFTVNVDNCPDGQTVGQVLFTYDA